MSTGPVAIVFGTRPEAIKMAPLVHELRRRGRLPVKLVVTAQHREMLDQVLQTFDLAPDVDLDLMRPGQGLNELAGRALTELGRTFAEMKPAAVLIHGDTSTTLVAGIAAAYAGAHVGHVEAGLRTGDKRQPFPEEINRRVAGAVADWHFAPTTRARDNLLAENIPAQDILVTGNTVIDALQLALPRARAQGRPPGVPELGPQRRLVLVTAHRRESFGEGLLSLCDALLELVRTHPDIELVYPVHPNPNVGGPVRGRLGSEPRIHLVEPQEYLPFLWLLDRAHLVITDSGGIQEEAPSLGKPVLVTREVTERPEAVEAGTVRLVGTHRARIVGEAARLLDDPAAHAEMARAVNPYGDGHACPRIAAFLESRLRHEPLR
jgi:UDP-N-acetylglucosamine 2-epimerase